ncbi:MAG TPA: GMC family oxidoreductase [Chloroflexota bacterium]|nr:GMC family oxidoreductase [Chloroflexota bacterium]
MKTLPKTDIVIIGLGAAGGIASYVLTKAGLRVVGIEAGPNRSLGEFIKQMDEIGGNSYRNQMGEPKFNKEIPTFRPNAQSANQPLSIAIRMMNGVGGTSVHYGTQSWRYRDDDFKMRTTTVERYGPQALPDGSAVADWPFGYAELEPYYDKVEYLIGVSGKGGSNRFESSRARDYPLPPLRSFGYGELAASAMRTVGYHPFPQPTAVLSRPYKGRPACSYCGFCSGMGCWNNSKSSTLVTAIAEAEKTGKLEIRPNSRVMQILADAGGNVTGVQYLDATGQLVEQPASFVILSTYVYENTRMLLLSKSKAFPNGLANNHGQVGKYYLSHSYVSVNGLFPGKQLNLYSGTSGQAVAMDDLNGDHFDHSGLGFIRGSVVFASNGNLPIGTASSLAPGAPGWGSGYKQWLHDNANSVASLFAQQETLAYESNFLDLDPKVKDPLGVPVVRITYDFGANEHKAGAFMAKKLDALIRAMGASKTWLGFPPIPLPLNSHAYGGTRLGADPATSVVDQYLIAHDVHNLAIMGGSTFPGTTGYNPTETIEATSWRAAEHIAANFNTLAV